MAAVTASLAASTLVAHHDTAHAQPASPQAANPFGKAWWPSPWGPADQRGAANRITPAKADGGVLEVLRNIQHSYTILGHANKGWRWGNAVPTLLVPQRGFLLGIPLAAMIFGQWWLARQSSDAGAPSSRRMMAAGAMAGLLPLVHAHSFVVVVGMAGCLALIDWRAWQDWPAFFLVAFAIAGPQVLWSTHQSAVSASSFIGIEFG